ncbi:hypothetical protein LB505_001956 [Fusarium chuoi]|nr:hypothetical protein LB505_001956 [Fusarium chuoi]
MDPAECLPPEIWREIIWNLRKPYHQGMICGLRWEKTLRLSALVTVLRRWQQLIEPILFKYIHLRTRLSYIRNATVKCVLASHICKRPKRCTQAPGDCGFRQHRPKDEIGFNGFVHRVVEILKDLSHREKPYMDMIFEMSYTGFSVTFMQKGCSICSFMTRGRTFKNST